MPSRRDGTEGKRAPGRKEGVEKPRVRTTPKHGDQVRYVPGKRRGGEGNKGEGERGDRGEQGTGATKSSAVAPTVKLEGEIKPASATPDTTARVKAPASAAEAAHDTGTQVGAKDTRKVSVQAGDVLQIEICNKKGEASSSSANDTNSNAGAKGSKTVDSRSKKSVSSNKEAGTAKNKDAGARDNNANTKGEQKRSAKEKRGAGARARNTSDGGKEREVELEVIISIKISLVY